MSFGFIAKRMLRSNFLFALTVFSATAFAGGAYGQTPIRFLLDWKIDGTSTPFLFASGYSPDSPGDERGSLPPELGVPLLHKPWTHDDVLTRVREILDRQ